MSEQTRESADSAWIAKDASTLPDFIIGGAMKSGTSTLHAILNEHPDVFIPEREVHFFDIDDPLQHGDFFSYNRRSKQWTFQDMERNPARMWEWYHSKFESSRDAVLKGEDSTTYLASEVAARRIAMQAKPIKLIFLLRHPTRRAYSQYFHYLRTGRAEWSFEETIRRDPASVLARSLYRSQIENYLKYIPRKRLHFIIFEDFIDAPEKTGGEVCEFLDIAFERLAPAALKQHTNRVRIPRSTSLQLFFNRLSRACGGGRDFRTLPFVPEEVGVLKQSFVLGLNRLAKVVNPPKARPTPAIRPETQVMLDQWFQKELEGLDELTGTQACKRWFKNHV